MSRRVLILVEGQTEEAFVNRVLAPALALRGVFVIPTIHNTKRVKDGPNFKGGVTGFDKFRNDLVRLLRDRDAVVTTLVDYYGLPNDFPGMGDRAKHAAARDRIRHVETALAAAVGSPDNFIPFVALHEFEAWVFADPAVLPRLMTEPVKTMEMAGIRADFPSPEDINDSPHTAPSKRILRLFPSYRKTFHGPNAVEVIGLDRIRAECPHFHAWVGRLEGLGRLTCI